MCDDVRARLAAQRDDELDIEEANDVRAHLAGCLGCTQADAELGRLSALTGTWRADGGDVWEAVRQEIAAPDMADVFGEIRRLRIEIGALHAEIADLRQQTVVRPVRPAATVPLFPYTAPAKPGRLVV